LHRPGEEEASIMSGPEGEMMARAAGRGFLRASHADRNQVVDVLKAAFIEGRLTKDELDTRLGQTLAARTYAELAAITADIPPGTRLPQRRQPAQAPASRRGNWTTHTAVKSGACAIGSIMLAVAVTATALGQPIAGVIMAVFIVMLTAVASALVGSVVGVALMIESRRRKRSQGRSPMGPSSGAGGQSTHRPPSAGPFPPTDSGQRYTAEAVRVRRPGSHVPGPDCGFAAAVP
jgi:hypothetical protein